MNWDVNYYSEKLKTKKFGFDENCLKPYFMLEKVLDGIFNLANKLYGLSFRKMYTIPVYHSDVDSYEVFDQDGEFLAVFRETVEEFRPVDRAQAAFPLTGCIERDKVFLNV